MKKIGEKKVIIDNYTLNKVKDIEKEIYKIFHVVTTEEQISQYKGTLLNEKINILETNFSEILTYIIRNYNKKTYMIKKSVNGISYGFIFSLTFMLINPYVTLLLNCILIFLKLKLDRVILEHQNMSEVVYNIIDRSDKFDITIDNCRRFLQSKIKEDIVYRDNELEDKELNKLILANEHIEIAVNGFGLDSIPEEMQEVMKKILQTELQTDEENLDVLLHLVAEREMEKLLEEEKVLKLEKKYQKNDKK